MASSLGSASDHCLSDILHKRTLPGLLVVEPTGRIVFASDEAQQFLDETVQGVVLNGTPRSHAAVPAEIVEFCREVARQSPSNGAAKENPPRRAMLFHGPSGDYMVMAVSLSRSGSTRRRLVFLVVQKIGQRKALDTERLGQAYGLTKREQEVVTRLVRGDSNKEIAASLKIGEYTVKDHLKHIMAKCDVGSRLSIISKALTT